ncbi:MAG: hypothetical protein JXB32_16655, partial [Deltaproteobacteria bacterium]|nr:hypothetical protein [Deltaproteobacteria bacterium]
ACDDGNPCTTGDHCSGGACLAGAGLPIWFRDDDDDTYGDAAVTVCAASAPSGYVANDDDCCDGDSRVRPDQTAWFNEAYDCGAGPSFDYDCNATEEHRWTATGGGCRSSGTSCTSTVGFEGSAAPACGASGTWVAGCDFLFCSPTTESRTQECR